MTFEQFSGVYDRIAALGGATLVDGQPGTAEAVFDQLRDAAARRGSDGGFMRQNAYQAFVDYQSAAEMGKPGIGYRPKCNFHVTGEPIGHVSTTYF